MSEAVSIYTYNSIGITPCSSFAANQGEWVFFSSGYSGYNGATDVKYKYTLSKIKKDGSGLKKICDDYAVCINVVGEYVYYVDCKSGCIKKINVDGSEEQVLLESQDYAPDELIVTEDMIYYLLYDSPHEDASGYYRVYGMKTDGTDKRYICTLGEEAYSRYIGIYNDMVCFGYNVRNVIIPDDEDDIFYTKNTGKYVIKGFTGYNCEDICCIENMMPHYAEIIDNELYYSSDEDIMRLTDFSEEKCAAEKISAYNFKFAGEAVVYTQYIGDTKVVRILSDGNDRPLFTGGMRDFSLFDDCAVILNNSGKVKIINYFEK